MKNTIQLTPGEIAVVTITKMNGSETSERSFHSFKQAIDFFESFCNRTEIGFEYPQNLNRADIREGETFIEEGGVGFDYRIELHIEREEEIVPVVYESDVLEIQDHFAPKVLMTFGRYNKEKECHEGVVLIQSEDGAIFFEEGSFSVDELNFNFALDHKGTSDNLVAHLINFGAKEFAKNDDYDQTFLRFEDRVLIVTNGRVFVSPGKLDLNGAFDFINSFSPIVIE